MDNTIDATPYLPEAAELTPVEFEADRVQVTIVVGVRVDGRKVQEIPLQVALCYPFDLAAILPQACAQARKTWEAQQQNA